MRKKIENILLKEFFPRKYEFVTVKDCGVDRATGQILSLFNEAIGEDKVNNHKEDGECGCKYLEEDNLCEIENQGNNQRGADIRNKLKGEG